MTAAVKPRVEDATPIDALLSAKLHQCLFLPRDNYDENPTVEIA